MSTDQLFRLLDAMQLQVRAFDTKAQVIIALDTLLAGLLSQALSSGLEVSRWVLSPALIIFLALAVVSALILIISTYCAIHTLVPRLHLHQPDSRVFFCTLVKLHGRNYKAAARDLVSINEYELRTEIGTQIQTLAVIADKKANRSRSAIILMGWALAAYLVACIPLALIQYHSRVNRQRVETCETLRGR